MSRVALVTGQVDGPIDVNREVGVDLDQAAKPSLIPVVAAPRLVRDVLDREFLVGWQLDVLKRSFPTRLDGALKHLIELVARDDECFPVRRVSLDERAVSREALFQLIENLLKVRFGIGRRD